MRYLPGLLLNPNKFDFFIDEYEVDFLREVKNNLIKKYYNLAFKSLWNATQYNLHKRIELFGTYEFIENLKGDDRYIYFSEFDTLSEKLNLLNPLVKVRNAYELEIINDKTLNVLNFFLTLLKSNSSEPLAYEDVTSVATLLERNLFKLRLDYKAMNIENFSHEKDEYSTNNYQVKSYNQNHTPRRRKSDYINTSSSKRYKKQDLMMLQQATPSYPKRRKEDFLKSYDRELGRRKEDRVNEEFIPRRRKSDWIVEEEYTPRRRRDNF